MRAGLAIAILILAAGCARPLSPNERGFAEAFFGPGLDAGRVQVAAGLGLTPPPGPRPMRFRRTEPPRDACERAAPEPRRGPPAIFVLEETMHLSREFYTADAMAGWPGRMRVPHALIMAHELTHVWQWQNRARTGYSARRAVMESAERADPYFYRLVPGRRFSDYGFEQQAAIVEDYVCLSIVDPSSPRLAALGAVLREVFPLGGLDGRP